MKVFIDTNVLLDLICQRDGFKEAADEIFKMGIEDKFDLYVSVLTLINAHFTAHRYAYSWEEIRRVLRNLLLYIKVSPMTSETFKNAIDCNGDDLEDSVQYFSALSSFCDCIVTRDTKGYRTFNLPIFTPNDFVKEHRK